MHNGKFVGGSALARIKAKKKKHTPCLKQNDTRRLGKSCSPAERFFASLLLGNSIQDFKDSENNDAKWNTIMTAITRRAGIPFPSSLHDVDTDHFTFYSMRAALVLEESRCILSEALSNTKNPKSSIHVEMIASKERKNGFLSLSFCKPYGSFFNAQEQFDLKPGCIVELIFTNHVGMHSVLTSIAPARNPDMNTVTLTVYNTQHLKGDLSSYYFSMKPLTTLISEQRQFVTCFEKPLVPFLSKLMGMKQSTHTRFDNDDSSEDNTNFTALSDDSKQEEDEIRDADTTCHNDCDFDYDPKPDARSHIDLSLSSIRCPKLNASQEIAARSFLNGPEHNLSLIQGPPGTGKTTFMTAVLLRTFFKGLQDNRDNTCVFDSSKRCLVTAPTNKAVSVIASRFLAAIGDFQQINCILIGVEDALFPRDENDSDGEEWQPLKSIYLYTWCNKLIEDAKFLESVDTSSSQQVLKAITFLNNLIYRLERSIPRAAKTYDLLKNAKCLQRELSSILNEVTTTFDRAHVMNLFKSLKELESSDELYSELLETSNIIFSTLTSSSVGIMKNTLQIDELFVDEAAAATEAEMVIPLHLHPKRMLAVGDPRQLPASVTSRRAATFGLDKSLLDRLMYTCGEDHVMLDTQYRMNPSICSFPSNQFYDGNLKDGENVLAPFYKSDVQLLSGRPYVFLDIIGDEKRSYYGSYYNDEEANAVVALVQQFSKMAQSQFHSDWCAHERIRIITFYSGQCKAINYKLRHAGLGGVMCATVDSSQGCESDIVIVSFVRCGGNTGFLHDDRRINVSLTRAKHQLICIGNADTLQRSGGSLEKFIINAKSRGLLKKLGNHNKRRIEYIESNSQDPEPIKKYRV